MGAQRAYTVCEYMENYARSKVFSRIDGYLYLVEALSRLSELPHFVPIQPHPLLQDLKRLIPLVRLLTHKITSRQKESDLLEIIPKNSLCPFYLRVDGVLECMDRYDPTLYQKVRLLIEMIGLPIRKRINRHDDGVVFFRCLHDRVDLLVVEAEAPICHEDDRELVEILYVRIKLIRIGSYLGRDGREWDISSEYDGLKGVLDGSVVLFFIIK